jgi:mannose-1-phosphate guanylyltransferase
LLAAGLGTRLRPLTERIPKCLVPVGGQPLLSIWLEICEDLGIESVLINTHHCAEQVREWAHKQKSRVKMELAHEEELLGSAGTLRANAEFVRGTDDFYVFYADNLVSTNLDALRSVHAKHHGVLTLGLFRSSRPRDCGIVTLDERGCVVDFEEKPAHPRSDLANAGIFVARQAVFDYIPARGFSDFGNDVMPRLAGRMWGCLLSGYIRDIGTLESYQKAVEEWPSVCPQVAPALSRTGDAARRLAPRDRQGIVDVRVER